MDELGKLLRDAGSGDRSAFEEVVRLQLGRLYGIALRLTGDRGAAEDVVQEVFLRILRNRVPRKSGSAAASWLARITTRRSIDLVRETAARRGREERYAMMRDSERRGAAAEDPAVKSEEIAALSSCLAALPEETRACLWLHFAEGFGVREVAACVGRGKSSTAERIQVGLKKLREDLGKRGFVLGAAPIADLLGRLPHPAVPEGLEARIRALPAGTVPAGSGGPRILEWFLRAGVGIMRMKPLILVGAGLAILASAGWGIAWKLSQPAIPGKGVDRALVGASPRAGPREENGPQPEARPPAEPVRSPAAAVESQDKTAPASAGTIHGRVLDLEEEPVAGARVKVRKASGGQDPIEATAGDDGSFEFASLPTGEYIVSSVDWCHFTFPEHPPVTIPTDEEVVLHMRPAAGMVVTILAEGRGPLPEAQVEVYRLEERRRGNRPVILTTDGKGRAFLGPFIMNPELGDSLFAFQVATFPPVSASVSIEKYSRHEIEVVLKPGTSVTASGTLRNLQGMPIPGIEMNWIGPEGLSAVDLWCVTDEEGRFRREGLSPGAQQVNILARHMGARGVTNSVLLGEGPEQEVQVTLDCIPFVLIRAMDSDGNPIRGATLRTQTNFKSSRGRTSGGGSVTTGEDGAVRLTAVPSGLELEVTLEDPKLGAGQVKQVISGPQEVVVLRVEPMPTVEGLVVDQAGDPVAGARITLITPRPEIKFVHGACDAAGKFSVKAAPGRYRLEANGGRRGAGAIDVEVKADGSVPPWHVQVAPKDAVLVHIVDPDGKASPDVEVRSESFGPTGSFRSILTDSEGWAALSPEEGPSTITVSPDFRKKYRPVPQIRDVLRGSPPIEVQLQRDAPRSISGIVLFDGKPVPHARVSYWGSNSGQVITPEGQEMCDEAGKFRLERVDGDDVYVLAWGPGFAMGSSPVYHLPPEGDVDGVVVEALAGRDFEAKVLDWEGKPASGVMMYFGADVIPPFLTSGKTDAGGMLRIPRVPPGAYRFTGGGPGSGQVAEREFQWTGAEDLTIKLRKPWPPR